MVSLHQTGRSANSLSKEYTISVSTIIIWIRQADPIDRNVLLIKERELMRENKRLKEEIDILKREYVNFQSFQTLDEAVVGFGCYIRWYNTDQIFLVT